MASPAHTYRPDIDGLRAISVGVVVAFHAFFRQGFGGFVGVDIFFVISGYLISGIILGDLEAGRFSFARFYGRRVRRIYPALVLVLAVTLAAGWYELFDDRFQQLGRHIAAAAAFVSNLVLYGESNYFDTSSDAKPLLHLWSLGVEEQFYILWPLVLVLAWRLGASRERVGTGFSHQRCDHKGSARGVWIALACALVASLAHMAWLMGRDVSAAFYIPTARFWEMLAGAALVWAERRGFAMPLRARHGLSLIGLALLLGGLHFITEAVPFPGAAALVPVLAAVMLIAAGPAALVNRFVLSLAPMRWLGQISYPLYLWHWPVLVLARTAGFVDTRAMVVAVLAGVVLAWGTTRLVEPPLRFGGASRAKTGGLLAAMGVLAGLGLLAGYGPWRSYTSARVAPLARQLLWTVPVGSEAEAARCTRLMPQRAGLVTGVSGNDFCYLSQPRAPDVALLGDSLNLSLYPGLARYADLSVLIASASEAAPFYDTTTTESFDKTRLNNWRLTNQALDFAIANPSIRAVVLSYANGDQLLNPASAHRITDRADPRTAPPMEVVERALRRTLARLTVAGKGVILIAPNARMGFDPADCLTGLRPIHGPAYRQTCAEPETGVMAQRRRTYDAVLARVAADYRDVRVVDLAPPLCDARQCYALRGGHLLYRDTLHLSDDGSRAVAPLLYTAIRQAASVPPPAR